MSELRDFLLARYAEDELLAENLNAYDGVGVQFTVAVDNRDAQAAAYGFFMHNAPGRVLLDIEAKRRIVEAAEDSMDWPPDLTDPDARETLEELAAHDEWVCRILALPYADHPDYRPEWKL